MTQECSKEMTQESKPVKLISWIDYGFFALLLLGLVAISFRLFHLQANAEEGTFVYFSDMVVYVREMLGTETECVFPYQVYFKIGAFVNLFTRTPEIAMALTTALLNAAAALICKVQINRLCLGGHNGQLLALANPENGKELQRNLIYRLGIDLAVIALFFASMLITPSSVYLPGINHQYLGIFSPTPWHNGTYLAARPFAILVFFCNIRMLSAYEKKDSDLKIWEYLYFAVILLLCTMTKPSFMIVHLGATGLIMLYRLFASKFQNFWPTICLGLCYLPTFGGLIYQYASVYVDEVETAGEGGIGFGFGAVWFYYIKNLPLAILLAMAFPIFVLILHWKELKQNKVLCHGWQLFSMGFLMNFFLYEKGHKFYDFNYCWGYMYGMFFAYLASLQVLIRDTGAVFMQLGKNRSISESISESNSENILESNSESISVSTSKNTTGNSDRKKLESGKLLKEMILLLLQWGLFALHVLCGIYFFLKLMGGNRYD